MEIEARWIGQKQDNIESKLKEIGADLIFDVMFREWIFTYPEWSKGQRRVRVRTDGQKHWLTYKANATWEVDSTEEVELTVSSAEDAVTLFEKIGIPLQRYQEKKRIEYKLGNTHFDLDFWPQIPMVIEIEAPSEEEVRKGAELLGLSWQEAIFVDQKVLHQKYYDVNLDNIPIYTFNKTKE